MMQTTAPHVTPQLLTGRGPVQKTQRDPSLPETRKECFLLPTRAPAVTRAGLPGLTVQRSGLAPFSSALNLHPRHMTLALSLPTWLAKSWLV